jgi:predicted nucleic acid-binding protein
VRFLDTNIFIRALVEPVTAADRTKAEASAALFRRLASGEETATTAEAMITEIAYVLHSRAHYSLTPAEIGARFRPILQLRGLKLPHKRTYLRALELWEARPSLDFEDVLAAAHVQRLGLNEITSYDLGFDRLPGVVRVEP